MYLLLCICAQIAVRLYCASIIHLSHTHTDVIVGLLINSSMYTCVIMDLFYSFHVNDIRWFRVTIFNS